MNVRLLKAISRLIRLPNLILILLTLSLVHYKVGSAAFKTTTLITILFGTVLIAAAGNVINDILDVAIDTINKPQKVIVGALISIKNAWLFYAGLNLVALVFCLVFGTMELLVFFLLTILLLYFYSSRWKQQLLIGNVIVALLCALVVFQYWWMSKGSLGNYWNWILMSYTGFAFFSTLARELIKDLEDMEGDRAMGCQTLAISLGIAKTNALVMAICFLLFLILLAEAIFLYQKMQFMACSYINLILIMVLLYLIKKVSKASTKEDYTILSKGLKMYMLLGVLLLFLV